MDDATPRPLEVEDACSDVKAHLKGRGPITVRGEMTNWRGPHTSGHWYFALSDPRPGKKAMVDAKAWRSTAGRIGFVPEPGDVVIVIAYGMMTVEEARAFEPTVLFPDTATNRLG